MINYDDDEYEDFFSDEIELDCDELKNFLDNLSYEQLIELANYLRISKNKINNMDKNKLINMILKESEYDIQYACEDLFSDEFDDFLSDYESNNRWRYSDYENKDIDDWDVDDHLAAWWDHMMEK